MKEQEKESVKEGNVSKWLVGLQNMSKDEVIQRCMELSSALEKANSDVKSHRELLEQLWTEHKHLKAKTPHIDATEYNKGWSWVTKIIFVLRKIKRPLLSPEIIEYITPYEPV